jgi:hypothetical protein
MLLAHVTLCIQSLLAAHTVSFGFPMNMRFECAAAVAVPLQCDIMQRECANSNKSSKSIGLLP